MTDDTLVKIVAAICFVAIVGIVMFAYMRPNK